MPLTASPPEASAASEIDAGVIEEARRRQRRRRATGIALGAVAAAIAISALLIGGGSAGKPGPTGEAESGGPSRLTLVHGRAFRGGQPALIGVTLSLQAGNAGVCLRIVAAGDCNGPLPGPAYPIYGGEGGFRAEEQVGPEGEIDVIFTGPGVAAMRVAHLGTFAARSAPGLPPGAKQIVFYRPPGSRGSVLAPGLSPRLLQGFERARHEPALTETLLDGSGHAIALGKPPPTFVLPNSYWHGTQPAPVRGRCAISSSLAGVRTQWAQVATELAPDLDISGPGWLTCLHAWLSLHGVNYETAILLDAGSPGRRPAPLWNAIPVPGHPGMVQIPPIQQKIRFRLPKRARAQVARELARDTKKVGRARAEEDVRPAQQLSGSEQTYRDVLVPPTVARLVGPAWVLVREGGSPAQRIAFLEALHVTKIELPHA